MPATLAQLKKLRGRSINELRVRGLQEFSKLTERLLGLASFEMPDHELLDQIATQSRNGSAEGTAALILDRIRGVSRGVSRQLAASRPATSQPPTSQPVATKPAASQLAASQDDTSTPGLLPSLSRRDEIVAFIDTRFPGHRQAIISRADRAVAGSFDLLGFSGLSFGHPIDWRLEPISRKRTSLDHWSTIDYLNPDVAGDKKITWELNRHAHFVTLGQAYWLSGDERFAAAFVQQATSWMDDNPPNRGINWASSLELAFRSISWLWSLQLFARSDRLTPDFFLRLLKHLVAHGLHIESYLSRYFSPNTHLTGEALGLMYLATALPELRRASHWRKLGFEILIEQLPIQVRDDGVYFEQASYYHRYTADIYTHLLLLARASAIGLPLHVEEKLIAMLDHLTWITRPDGSSPLIGDDDGGRLINLSDRAADDFRDTLATGAALFGRGDWKHVAGNATVESLWLLGPEGLAAYDDLERRTPRGLARAFARSGHFAMRDGWSSDSSSVLVDCGPHGTLNCGHAHSDALAFEFAANGKTWLVDPGAFTYTANGAWRDEFRGTAAHNTVTVDDQPQSTPDGPFSWKHVAGATAREFIGEDDFNFFEGWHDGFERLSDPVTHARSVLFVKRDADQCRASPSSYVVVRDTFNAREEHRYHSRYHFAPGCRASASGSVVSAEEPGGDGLTISAFCDAPVRASVVDGWVSPCYGRRQPAPVGTLELKAVGPIELFTFILPRSGSAQSPEVDSPRVGLFTIKSGATLDLVIAGDGKATAEAQRLIACGLMAWARFVDGTPVEISLIHGKNVGVRDRLELRSGTSIRYCAIGLRGESVNVSIDGASRFTLSAAEPMRNLVVNQSRFEMGSPAREATLERTAWGWKMIQAS